MRKQLVVAGATWIVATALLLVAPLVSAADPSVAGLPSVGSGSWWACLAMLTAQAAALVVRSRRPLLVVLGVSVGPLALAGLGAGDGTSIGVAAVLVAVWSAVTLASGRRLAYSLVGAGFLVVAGVAASQVSIGLASGTAIVAGVLQALVVIGLPAVGAAAVRARREARTARTDLADAVEREHSALVAAAIARERMAMARELHDIAAHHLTGIAVMTGAVERQIDTDPAGAKESVRQVRTQSTSMLRELRGLVGLLRDPGGGTAGAGGRERLAGIPALVQEAGRSGLDVHLETLGPGAEVGPLAQLSAYRTVQECLSNAARHAPGARCEVTLDSREPGAIVVTVRNGPATTAGQRFRQARSPAGAGASGGFGLIGMQERADLTDAELDAGPTADGGWQVTLRIPTTELEEAAR